MKEFKNLFFLLFLATFTGCQTAHLQEIKEIQTVGTEANSAQAEQTATENPKEKAIRLAEEFIRINGYTKEVADKEHLSHETVEFVDNVDELLEQRHDSLESKAYGFLPEVKGNKNGWTVVFRHNKNKVSSQDYDKIGRAVTMK